MMSENVHQTEMLLNDIDSNSSDKSSIFIKEIEQKILTDFINKYKTVNDIRTLSHGSIEKGQKGNRHSPLYNFLGYSSKKAYEPIQAYIRAFSKTGDLVYDPFSGSGGVGLVCSHIGRNCVMSDLSPLAAHISKAYCTNVDILELETAFTKIKKSVENIEKSVYGTICHNTNSEAIYESVIWSQTYRCKKCFEIVPLKSTLDGSLCPKCKQQISTRQERNGYVIWGVNYRTTDGKHNHRYTTADQETYANLQKIDIKANKNFDLDARNIGFVNRPLMNSTTNSGPWGLLWRPYHGDIRTVADFFTDRNLYALQYILNEITALNVSEEARLLLKLALASIIPACSKQQRHYPGSTFPNMVMPGVLYVPPIFEEINVFRRFLSKKRSLISGQKAVNNYLGKGKVAVVNANSNELSSIPAESIDYIFTDPPYGGRIQYGELSFLQEAFLGFNTEWLQNEIIINDVRGIKSEEWKNRLGKTMEQAFRILKPGRWISVCFHDSDPQNWVHLQNAMAEAGFIAEGVTEAASMHTGWQTLKMHTSSDITKRDLVVSYRKPFQNETNKHVEISGDDNNDSFTEKIRTIVRDLLSTKPGLSYDRIYDEIVARMVSKGQLEVHDFNSILSQIAIESKEPVKKDLFENEDPDIFGTHEISRWYLKETELAITDTAESEKEDEGARQIANFISKKIKEINPDADVQKASVMKGMFVSPNLIGVHYSELFENYIYAVKDKPRRQLSEWLIDYFFKTDEGTYRLPATEEEAAAKAEGRSKGTNRRVKRYLALLEQGAKIPETELPNDATLCEWIRHCKRAGNFEQGKILYEKGGLQLDSLTEEQLVEVEEDYQVCVRMLARETKNDSSKPARRTRKKA